MKNTLFIIDAYNLIYRMFYALPEMTTRDGRHVNAIFWVAKFLRSLAEENPFATLIVATDVGQSFRANLYTEYKATRDRMPDNLRSQIDWVFSLFEASGIQVLSHEWYEADDIIGTIAHNHSHSEYQVVIISSDKDLCQFVRDGEVHIYDAMKRKFMKRADVMEKFWVPPEQVRDYLAIVGDSSDNIPGISWFGPKKAVDLLTRYTNLEWIYEHIDDLTAKMQEVLEKERENAFLSQELARIKTDISIDSIEYAPFAPGLQNHTYIELLKWYEFKALLPKEAPKSVNLPELQVIQIETISDLDTFLSEILAHITEPLSLSSDSFGGVFCFWFLGKIYRIESTRVDMTDFVQSLFDSDILLVGYRLKEDVKHLQSLIKNPLEIASEGQGKLF